MRWVDKAFWWKIARASGRLLGAFVLFWFHYLLHYSISFLGEEYKWAANILSTGILVAFIVISFLLLVGAVLIFIPKRQGQRQQRRRQ